MAAALQLLLDPQVLTRTVSQVAASSDWLQTLFGLQPGGPNCVHEGHGRDGAFHIYDNVRKVAKGRAPGTAAGRRAANPMGRVQFTYPRMHDSVSLSAEVLHNLGKINDPAVRDKAGAEMISRQTNTLGQLASNWRKAMLVGMLRDSLYVGVSGDDEYFTYTDPSAAGYRINFQMPAGNKTKLDMLGGGDIITTTWASDSTDIPLQLGNINAAFQQLCGGHLGAIVTNWGVWNSVIQNAFVQAMHGTSNPPFVSLEHEYDSALGKTMKNVFRAKLNVLPNVTWYITDEGLEVGAPGSETYTKIIEANKALFIGFEPGDNVLTCYEGSEPIAEHDAGPEDVKVGMAAWSVKRSNPTSTDLFVLDNALVVNHIPKSVAYGTVVF